MKTTIGIKKQTAELKRKEHNAIIKFLKNNEIELTNFVIDYNKKYINSQIVYSTYRYKLNSATLTKEEMKNTNELISLIKSDLKIRS